jgi:hypothetical protein
MATVPAGVPRLSRLENPIRTWDWTSFLNSAREFGLPINYLITLQKLGWKCVVDPDASESETPGNWYKDLVLGKKTIHLAPAQLYADKPMSPEVAQFGTSTIYHEFTHAYLREYQANNLDVKSSLWNEWERWYDHPGNLEGGKKAFFTDLVVQESAADYVGSTIWAFTRLQLNLVALKNGTSASGVQFDQEQQSAWRNTQLDIWSQFLNQTVFGVYVDSFGEWPIAIPVCPSLAAFLDQYVLEQLRRNSGALLQCTP